MDRLVASLTLLRGSGRARLGRFAGSVTLYTRVPWPSGSGRGGKFTHMDLNLRLPDRQMRQVSDLVDKE